ncbi:MAG: tetratricopeptide repeat protein [Gammaproteobacteria bacterium]
MAQERLALGQRAFPPLAALLSVVLLLGGCRSPSPRSDLPGNAAGEPQPSGPLSPAPLPPPPPRAPPPPRENRLSAATSSLVTQARTLISRGDLDGASSTLDRALRIEPNNPLLWIERGRLRLAESDARQAEGCARKALVLASGDHGAQAQAGRLLVDALRAQRRNQEASEVEAQPFMQAR